MQESIEVVRGVLLPFFPIQPTSGRTLRAPRLITELYHEIKKPGVWIAQPLLAGQRAILTVVDNKVYVHDNRGKWLRQPLLKKRDFLKLPNRTTFDGVIFDDEYHPFDLITLDGKSFIQRPAAEREALAFQMVRLVEHHWMFSRPAKTWLLNGVKNMPNFKGVILKDAVSHYSQGAKPCQRTLAWFSRKWA